MIVYVCLCMFIQYFWMTNLILSVNEKKLKCFCHLSMGDSDSSYYNIYKQRDVFILE